MTLLPRLRTAKRLSMEASLLTATAEDSSEGFVVAANIVTVVSAEAANYEEDHMDATDSPADRPDGAVTRSKARSPAAPAATIVDQWARASVAARAISPSCLLYTSPSPRD